MSCNVNGQLSNGLLDFIHLLSLDPRTLPFQSVFYSAKTVPNSRAIREIPAFSREQIEIFDSNLNQGTIVLLL